MNDRRAALIHLGSLAAQEIDDAGGPWAGIVRQLARALLEAPEPAPVRTCPACGTELTGRQRTACSERCRSQLRRT